MMSPLLSALLAQAPATETPPANRARANLARYVGTSDYPLEALLKPGGIRPVPAGSGKRRTSATASFWIPADPKRSTRQPCRLMTERARFVPASDSSGAPARDRMRATLHWQLPEPPPPLQARARADLSRYIHHNDYPRRAMARGEQGVVHFALEVDAQGQVQSCRILESSGSADLDERTCEIMESRPRFIPAVGMDGEPAADVVRAATTWTIWE